MIEQMETDADRLILVLILKKQNFDRFCKIEVSSFSKPKVVYVRFIFSTIFQILETKFYIF